MHATLLLFICTRLISERDLLRIKSNTNTKHPVTRQHSMTTRSSQVGKTNCGTIRVRRALILIVWLPESMRPPRKIYLKRERLASDLWLYDRTRRTMRRVVSRLQAQIFLWESSNGAANKTNKRQGNLLWSWVKIEWPNVFAGHNALHPKIQIPGRWPRRDIFINPFFSRWNFILLQKH